MIQNDTIRGLFVPYHLSPTDEAFAAASGAMIAMPIPWVEADDITNEVLFLVSDAGRYVSGVTLPVEGSALLK